MKPRTNGVSRVQSSKGFQEEGPIWMLIAGGALLSALSMRLGYKLKQVLDAKQPANSCTGLKGNGKCTVRTKSEDCHQQSNAYDFTRDESGCFNYVSGTQNVAEIKQKSNGLLLPTERDTDTDTALPLVTVPPTEFNKENGVIWVSCPDRLEMPQKPFHNSNSSGSPRVSESGSDIFGKREVIQKLRQQLKRRDDMLLEMQDQIAELQKSINTQFSHSSHLQSLLDIANRDLLDSEREIQRLRNCRNGHGNGYLDGESNFEYSERGRDVERIEMLRREVGELKEVIEGKNYLLQNYKEQKAELSTKVKELQQRLDSQLPNIL